MYIVYMLIPPLLELRPRADAKIRYVPAGGVMVIPVKMVSMVDVVVTALAALTQLFVMTVLWM